MMYTPDNAPGRRAEASSQLRVIVLGYIVRGPLGGLAWHHLQYVMGLRLLGYDVYFVEDSNDYPACYDPVRNVTDENPDFGLKFAARTFARVGLADRWAYYDAHTSQWLGPGADSILDVCSTADLLLDLSPMDPLRPWLMEIPARALIDTDPGFRQVRHLKDPEARSLALQHTGFFSFGENCASGDCSTPDDGLHWRPTRQPIVLDAWPVKPGPAHGKFTTVMQWDSYPAIEHNGRRYGMKSDSFAPYMDLPARAGPIFELAVGSATAPPALLRKKGWQVRDSREPTRDPWTYQSYIQQSKAEFAVAKHGYIVCRCGWFSERSAAYLASGRPVLAQETGFSDWLPSGRGVLSFNNPEEALAGIEEVNRRYRWHCEAARALAEEFFDARKVLPRLVEEAMDPATANRAMEVNPYS